MNPFYKVELDAEQENLCVGSNANDTKLTHMHTHTQRERDTCTCTHPHTSTHTCITVRVLDTQPSLVIGLLEKIFWSIN